MTDQNNNQPSPDERLADNAPPSRDDAAQSQKTPPPHPTHHSVGIIWRFYALIPIILVLWLSFKAIHYLVSSMLYPPEPVPQITQIPTRLTEDVFRARPSRWIGTAAAEEPRAPIAHFHRIEDWYQHDIVNDCTRSGCHNPMPHNKRKEARAFLNMHATSIHCGVCHIKNDQVPLPLAWYDIDNGRLTEPPAVLQAYGWITSEPGRAEARNPTPQTQDRIVNWLRQAAAQSGGNRGLLELADIVAAPRYNSSYFQQALALVRESLPRHFRGEYGAKLALRSEDRNRVILGHRNNDDAVREFFRTGADLPAQQRQNLLDRVHTQRRSETLHCGQCHTAEHSLVDLDAAGYPLARIQKLRQGLIFRAIEDIRQGRDLQLPGFLMPNDQPTSPDSGNNRP